ncbi:hypothetical protein [Spongiactinospora sp. TRM90649]|uniref:hypothetical protein n=1 Tax=Spongiactinospora sp. TRM90649 TaxID=3031114 RepID=UPI0023F7A036|nr:hypothetical protein [Spongiactinospora sp. TRM90649]MDF5759058.1 hypothetical protein [Spongiactinospora sp. TRM90649]
MRLARFLGPPAKPGVRLSPHRALHKPQTGTFASPDGGVLGYVVEGQARILSTPRERVTLRVPAHAAFARVPLYTAVLGDDAESLRAIAAGADGLVVAAMGAGHVPACYLDTLTELAGRIPVVLASRTGSGPVLTATYSFPGSERDLLARGLLHAGFLHPYKARILLTALVTAGASTAEIKDTFATAGGVNA